MVYYFMLFLGAYLLCFSIMPICIKTGKKYFLDYPTKRKVHNAPKPRAGGMAIYFTLLIFSIVTTVDIKFLIPLTFIFIIGLIDDYINIPAVLKLACQIITAVITVILGITITSISIMGLNLDLGLLSQLFTVIWFVSIMNAFNLIDGLDGLSSGTVLISCILMIFVSLMSASTQIISLLVIITGATLGFIRYNLPPSQAFLGDSGSLMLGYLMAYTSAHIMIYSNLSNSVNIIGIILIMFVPIVDTSWAIIRRVIKGMPIFKADKGHIHHELFKTFKSDKMILIAILCWGTFIGILGLLSILLDNFIHNFFFLTCTIISAVIIYNLTKVKALLSYQEIAVCQKQKETK